MKKWISRSLSLIRHAPIVAAIPAILLGVYSLSQISQERDDRRRERVSTAWSLLKPQQGGAADALETLVNDGAKIQGTDLSNMLLNGVRISATKAGDSFRNAKFNGANLTGADFSGVDLTGAQFHCANIAGADFTGATLTDANFRGAHHYGSSEKPEFSNVIIDGTVAVFDALSRPQDGVVRNIVDRASFLTESDFGFDVDKINKDGTNLPACLCSELERFTAYGDTDSFRITFGSTGFICCPDDPCPE